LVKIAKQGVSNQAFNQDNHEACARQRNVEEAKNGAKWTLAKLVNTNMQMKISEKRRWYHTKCKWKPVKRKSDTTRNEPHNAKQERLSEAEESVRGKCCPRFNISLEIPNFNSRNILCRLGAPKRCSI